MLFPIFCHFYLDLIEQGFKEAGVLRMCVLLQHQLTGM